MDAYERYLDKFKKVHNGSTKGAATRYAYDKYHGVQMTAQRAGLKPGSVVKAAEERGSILDAIRKALK